MTDTDRSAFEAWWQQGMELARDYADEREALYSPDLARCQYADPNAAQVALADHLAAGWTAATAAATERAAKICDEESRYRIARDRQPLPGDPESSVQGHKAVTAKALAAAIRATKDQA